MTITPERIAELRALLAGATSRSIPARECRGHYERLADRLIWNGSDGGDGDLHALLDEIERLREFESDCEAAASEAERWAAMTTDLHGTVRAMVNELKAQQGEIEAQQTEIDRLRAVIRETHAHYCAGEPRYASGKLHAPECRIYEIEP